MSDRLQKIPSFNEVMKQPTQSRGVPSFDDIMKDEPVKKKEDGGRELTSNGPSKLKMTDLLYERNKQQMTSDLRKPEQKAQPSTGIKAGFTQVQSPKKDETFRIEITDKEAEGEAVKSFQRGDHAIEPNSADPVGDLHKQINIDKYSYPKYKIARKKIEILNDAYFPTGEDAKVYLEQNQDKDDKNVTKQLATKKYGEYKLVDDAVSKSSSLEEAAIKYAASKGDEQVKYFLDATGGWVGGNTESTSAMPLAMKGEKLLQFLMNKDLMDMAEKNPALKTSMKEELFNFPVHHPEYATKLLAEAIANKRDEKNLNSKFANIVSKETTDKIVKELIEEGTLPANYQFLYEKEIRPKLGTWQSIGRGIGNIIPGVNQLVNESPIPTPGVLENIEQGLENTQVGIAKSILNLPSVAGLPTITDALQSREQQTYNVLKKQFETPQFEPSRLGQKMTMHGGQMIPFVAGLVGGTSALRAFNIVKNPALASATMMALGTLGDTGDKAKSLFPRNDFKQHLYIGSMTALNSALGRFLPGQQIPKLLAKDETVATILKKMVDGEIATSAAKNQMMEWFGETIKGSLRGAEFMAAIGAADDALTQVLESKNLNLGQTLEAGWEGFKLGLIATPLLAGAEASLKSNKGFREQIISFAENPEYYKILAEREAEKDPEFAKIKQDVVNNIDYVSGVYNELYKDSKLSDKDIQKYVLNSLNEKIKLNKADSATDPTVKKKLQQEAKEIQEINEGALNGLSEEKIKLNQATDKVKKLYDDGHIVGMNKIMLEKVEGEGGKPKFDETKVKAFLEYVAQQSNNVDAEGNFNKGSDVRKSIKYPKQLIDAANEMFPEFKKTAEDNDALAEQDASPMQKPEGAAEMVSPSTSVIMPGEIKHPETTTIKPKETEADVKPKVSVILPESKKEVEVTTIGGEPPISEPPAGGGVFSERPPTELSHKGLQDVANEFSLPDVKTRDTKSDVQLRQDAREVVDSWAEKGEYAKNVEGLVRKAESREILTDKERVILEGHLANIQNEARGMNVSTPEYDAKLAEIKRLKDAGEITRSEAGAALRIPTGGSRPKSVEDAMIEEMDVTQSDILTEKQKQTVEREFKEEENAQSKWDAKRAKMEQDRDERQGQKVVDKIVKESKAKGKPPKDYAERRKALREKLKEARDEHEQFLKDQGIQKAGFGSLTGKEAKVILEIAKEYIEEGAVKLADAVKKTLDEVKDILPNIQERDIRDVIAGKYSDKKTRTQLAIALQDLRTEQNLIDKIEQLERGEMPKAEKKKQRRNREITDLRNKLKALKSKYFSENTDAAKLDAYKSKMKIKIEEISKQIKKGDFAPPEKPEPIVMDEEAIRLKDRLIKIKNEKKLRQLRVFYANQTNKDKVIRTAIEIANVPRAIMASLDFSALLRQAIIPTISRPRTAFRFSKGEDGRLRAEGSIAEMFRGGFSQKLYDRWFADLAESPRFEGMKKSKLAVTDSTDPNLQAREEAFMSSLADKIPFIGTRLIKGSERAYSMALNKIRVDMYNRFADYLETRGKTVENSPEMYKHMAEYINNATGRGDIHGWLEKSAPILNAMFFSPRLIAARLNMLSFLGQLAFKKQVPKEVIRAYMMDMIKFVGIGVSVLALAKYGFGADVESDPRSSDFGKIKYGNTRWDIWGGFQQYARLIAQIGSGQRKSTRTGEIQDLDGKGAFGDDRWDAISTMGRGKLAPVPSMIIDLIKGRNIIGEEIKLGQWTGEINNPDDNSGKGSVGLGEYLGQHLLPLNATSIAEAFNDRGIRAFFDVAIPSTFGIGVQTYEPTQSDAKTGKKPTKPTKKEKSKPTKPQ